MRDVVGFQYTVISPKLGGMSDPIYERQYFRQPNGNYSIGECFLTVSLGEPYNDDYVYKLVAAIIEP